MHLCMSRASRYFPVKFSTDAYLWYLCLSWYHAGSLVCDGVLARYLDELGLGGTYTSSLSGSMCAYVGCVWRSTTYPSLPGLKVEQDLAMTFLKVRFYHDCLCMHSLPPIVELLTKYFLKYSSHVLLLLFM